MIKVTIEGPGMCIHKEYEVIINALKNAGCAVTVTERGCSAPRRNGASDGFLYRHHSLNIEADDVNSLGSNVQIVVSEQPWGG